MKQDMWFTVLMALIFLLVVLTDEAQAEYDPDSYGYVSVFTGIASGNTWIDSTPTSEGFGVGYVHRISGSWFIEGRWAHISQLAAGMPFNDIDESWVDHVGVALEYRF